MTFMATTTAGRIEELAKLLARECPLDKLLLAIAHTDDARGELDSGL